MIPISGIISSSFYFLSGWSSELIDQVTRRLRSVTSKFPETLQSFTTGVEIKVSGFVKIGKITLEAIFLRSLPFYLRLNNHQGANLPVRATKAKDDTPSLFKMPKMIPRKKHK
jgi:hypothetical protein